MKSKNIVKLLCVAALLAFAGEARATYSIGVTTSADANVAPGASGSSYFDFSFSGTPSGNFTYQNKNLWAVDSLENPLFGSDTPFSSLTIDGSSTLPTTSGSTYATGSSYRLVVDWTVKSSWTVGSTTQYGIYFNLYTHQPDSQAANAGATDLVSVHPVGVPEPSQIMAGSLLLGCGILVFSTRRLFKQQSK